MRGTLYERAPGVWECRVDLGKDPATGKRRRLTRTVRGGRRVAQRALNDLLHETAAGRHRDAVAASRVTFGALAAEWWAVRSPDLAVTTAAGYRAQLDGWILPAFGEVPLRELSAAHLDRLYRALTDAGLAGSTVARYHALVHTILRRGVRWGWVPVNVADMVEPPAAHRVETVTPDAGQVRVILEAAAQHSEWFGLVARLAVATGARRGELAGLRWGDLDGSRLTVARAVVEVGRRREVKSTKTHAVRSLTLDEVTVAMLEAWRVGQETAMSGPVPAAWFILGDESPPSLDRITRAWYSAVVPVAPFQMRSLRNANITLQLDRGIPVKTVQYRAGHATSAMTLDVYARAVAGRDQDAADAIGDALDGGEG